MDDPLGLHGLACVAHVHSTYSDGTATVAEIVDAARAARADAVLLTDHDTLAARRNGEEGWRNGVLVLAGHEVSPKAGHLLVFGVDEVIAHAGRSEGEICAAVRAAGGISFAAHPFSEGSRMSKTIAPPHGWSRLDDAACGGIELWSLTSDAAEAWRTPWEAFAFLRDPMAHLGGPPADHLRAWDALCRTRRVPAIGGLDAHQHGIRVGGRVRSPMPHARYFALLQTHVLLSRPPAGSSSPTPRAVEDALREGRCYLAFEGLAPGRGLRFWAERDGAAVAMGARATPGAWTLRAIAPRRCPAAAAARRRDGRRGRGRDARAPRRRRGRLPARGTAPARRSRVARDEPDLRQRLTSTDAGTRRVSQPARSQKTSSAAPAAEAAKPTPMCAISSSKLRRSASKRSFAAQAPTS